MTELVVALDGPNPGYLALRLWEEACVRWIKLRASGLVRVGERWVERSAHHGLKIFADLKDADTADSVREDIKWLAGLGIAAVSTFTDAATSAALDAGVPNIAIWQVHALTDDITAFDLPLLIDAPGVICPGCVVTEYVQHRETLCQQGMLAHPVDIVVPGVRLNQGDDLHGHRSGGCLAWKAREAGATHAVVGRPIWQSEDPIAAAREFIEALSGKDTT